MPYIIPSDQFKEIIDGKRSEIVLKEVPVEKLQECVGFTYRWLPEKKAKVTVTYITSKNKSIKVETGINADLLFVKKCLERNPSDYYWMDCICVPQDNLDEKTDEIKRMRTYYSNFKRVAFLGRLDGVTHDGHFEMVRTFFTLHSSDFFV